MKHLTHTLILIVVVFAATAAAQTLPPLTTKHVRESLRDKTIAPLNEKGKVAWRWTFARQELLELDIVAVESAGDTSTLLVDIRTQTSVSDVKAHYTYNNQKPCRLDSLSEVTGRMKLIFMYSGTEYVLTKIEPIAMQHRFIQNY